MKDGEVAAISVCAVTSFILIVAILLWYRRHRARYASQAPLAFSRRSARHACMHDARVVCACMHARAHTTRTHTRTHVRHSAPFHSRARVDVHTQTFC
jgi:hypothetical protein